MSGNDPLLQMKDIKKSFNTVEVLKGMDFTLNEGEIVGLIGENGAGKSTLIKILCGVYKMSSGAIYIDGEKVDVESTEMSQKLGISTIYQELSLFPTMTIAENIFMHREYSKGGKNSLVAKLDHKRMNRQAEYLLREKLQVDLDVKKRIEELTLADRQMVEIARAISSDARIIIMDEPTTALENKGKNQLFNVMRTLKEQGCSIVFISHHLDELFEVCDRINVLRDGNKVLDKRSDEINIDELISAMIGKTLDEQYPKKQLELGKVAFSVSGLTKKGSFRDISFDIHEREIVGVIGLAGCGKNELIRALFGIEPYDGGSVTLRGRKLRLKRVKDAMDNRIAFLPSERKVDGIFPQRSVEWNTSIAALENFTKNTMINKKSEKSTAENYVANLRIKLDSLQQPIASLSGGNQQKVMLARWFLTEPDILLMEEPTRGIDVNAKTEVYNLITRYVEKGKCVFMVSSEEEEVYGMCDRIIVMHNGEITAVLNAKETTLEQIKYYSKVEGDSGNESKIC